MGQVFKKPCPIFSKGVSMPKKYLYRDAETGEFLTKEDFLSREKGTVVREQVTPTKRKKKDEVQDDQSTSDQTQTQTDETSEDTSETPVTPKKKKRGVPVPVIYKGEYYFPNHAVPDKAIDEMGNKLDILERKYNK